MESTTPVIICDSVRDYDVYCYCGYSWQGISEDKGHSFDLHILYEQAEDTPEYPFPLSIDKIKTQSFPPKPVTDTPHPRTSSHTRIRSLTDPLLSIQDEMTAFIPPPGSPPELTSSKSSKSSSCRSSSFSGTDGISSDLSHFEEIGLNDDHSSAIQSLYGPTRLSAFKSDGSRRTPPTMNGNRSQPSTLMGMRELVHGTSRPSFPSLQGPVKYAVAHTSPQSLGLPNGQGSRRIMRSPSTSKLALTAMRNRSKSRSRSPTHPNSRGTSPNPGRSSVSSLQPVISPVIRRSTSRTGSWRASRKTAKELEDEYHDSDEELPDDASLWNVPLSPGLYRANSSAVSSANPSPSTSPERASHFSSSSGMMSIRPTITVPAAGRPNSFNLRRSVPSSPIKPSMPHSNSTGTFPDGYGYGKRKSWNVALSELSEEAKSLNEALEAHAVESDRQHEERLQNGASSIRPSIEKLARSQTAPIELPPLRKSNVMIDPLPISKEKEKVLSRTRPSWLPPKNKKEEKKHLKEYQKMMEMSAEADKKKAARAVSLQCAKDDTKASLQRIWEEHVLPNWDQIIHEPRTRELWWRGITPSSRAEVWIRAIGNELGLTQATYAKALQRAKGVEKDIRTQKGGDQRKEKAWFDAIRRDVVSTFPDLKMFQLGRPLYGALVDVLMAYSMYRSDIGYCHGSHLPAALLLLTCPTQSLTFTAFANLFNRPLPLTFMTGDPAGTSKTYALTVNLLRQKFSKLHSHLLNPVSEGGLALAPEEILEPMIRSLFLRSGCESYFVPRSPSPSGSPRSTGARSPGPSGNTGMDMELVSRIWDVMIFDGDSMIIRTCVAVLGCLEAVLYGNREEVLAILGWEGKLSGLREIGEDEFMTIVREVGKEERRGAKENEKA